MQYIVNDTILYYESEGPAHRGENRVLLNDGVDLTSPTSWSRDGYTVVPLITSLLAREFQQRVDELLRARWRDAGLTVPDNFQLDQYHTLVPSFESHLKAIEFTKLLHVKDFPLGIEWLEDRISDLCGCRLEARNPFDGQSIFHFRVIRPNHRDNNPLHRDIWLEDYDNCINLYIPVCGSNQNSSLIIIPGSHRWPESRIEKTVGGAIINGVNFNVPAVTAIDGDYSVLRPDPGLNEVLIFSPYLIHGGAVNLNTDTTRISIEIRLWRKG